MAQGVARKCNFSEGGVGNFDLHFISHFFPKMGMFLCSLDWKFPEFFKTHPTFVCCPSAGGVMGIYTQIPLFLGTPCMLYVACNCQRKQIVHFTRENSLFRINCSGDKINNKDSDN